MKALPPLRKILSIWAVLTGGASAAVIAVMRVAAPAGLPAADSLGFQALVALVFVGAPSLTGLGLALLIGTVRARRSPAKRVD